MLTLAGVGTLGGLTALAATKIAPWQTDHSAHGTDPAWIEPVDASTSLAPPAPTATATGTLPPRQEIISRYGTRTPHYWGLHPDSSWSTFPTDTSLTLNSACLTFDACSDSSGYDERLINRLREQQIPATLFVNQRWATTHRQKFESLMADPLFEIGNHGTNHRPLSVSGRSAYGIAGTKNVAEVYDEIAGMHTWMDTNYDLQPKFFRPGTAHADNVATQVSRAMGEWIVMFSVNGDAGATASANQVYQQFLQLRPGGILLAHFNRPGSETAAGVERALPVLVARGLHFRRLGEVLPATTSPEQPPRW
ncbi:polysaccharide deacetylase family protein [Salinispora cortesiana]|uniref:polysaccharide deacetylase family protein n=1 Tax=Salinispora cortesiana TaxID=1305843 RepID=UPI0009B7A2CE|nr:polysaccharide deacetylase family protein [Salinispora cortesiana]